MMDTIDTFWNSEYPVQSILKDIADAMVKSGKMENYTAAEAFVISVWNEAFWQGEAKEAFNNSGQDQ